MCVCVCIHTSAHLCACTYGCMYVRIYPPMLACIHAQVYSCSDTCAQKYMHMCAYRSCCYVSTSLQRVGRPRNRARPLGKLAEGGAPITGWLARQCPLDGQARLLAHPDLFLGSLGDLVHVFHYASSPLYGDVQRRFLLQEVEDLGEHGLTHAYMHIYVYVYIHTCSYLNLYMYTNIDRRTATLISPHCAASLATTHMRPRHACISAPCAGGRRLPRRERPEQFRRCCGEMLQQHIAAGGRPTYAPPPPGAAPLAESAPDSSWGPAVWHELSSGRKEVLHEHHRRGRASSF